MRYGWTATGDPEMSPGQVVTLRSPAVNGTWGTDLIDVLVGLLPVPMWLMRVSHRITPRGWTTPMHGWAGAGRAIASGVDCAYTTILGSKGRHVGNEYLGHYRRPNPDGLEVKIPFTVAADYTTLTIRGLGHGTNSFVRNQESEASRFETWQGGQRKASGDMPRIPEYLERWLPYKPPSLPIRLEDGTSTMNADYFWQRMVSRSPGRSTRARPSCGSSPARIPRWETRTTSKSAG